MPPSDTTTTDNKRVQRIDARLVAPTALRAAFAAECLPWGEVVVDQFGCVWIGDGETIGGVSQKSRSVSAETYDEARALASTGDFFTVGLGTACQKTYMRGDSADLTIDRGNRRVASRVFNIARETFANTVAAEVNTIFSGNYTAVCDGELEAAFYTSELFIQNNSIVGGAAPINVDPINQALVQVDFLVDGIVRGSAVIEGYGTRFHRVPIRIETGSLVDVAAGQTVALEVRVTNDNGLDLNLTNGAGYVSVNEYNR